MIKTIAAALFLFFSSGCSGQPDDQADFVNRDTVIARNNRIYAAALQSGNDDSLYLSLETMFEIYLESGDYARSFDYAEQLYNIAIGSGRAESILEALTGLGKLYSAIEDYPHALNYFRRALDIREKISDQFANNNLELKIAETFANSSQYDSAWVYFNRYSKRFRIDTANYRLSTGEFLFRQGKFQNSLENFDSAKNNASEITDLRVMLDIAKVYAVLGDPKAAIRFGRTGVEKALVKDAVQYLRDGYKIISDAFEQMGLIDSSNFYFRKYAVARDIVLNAQTRGKMAALTYEQQISRMNQENEIQEMNMQKQALFKNILLIGILLLMLFTFLLSRYLIVKRKAAIRQRQIVENEMTIQRLESEKTKATLEQQKIELEIKALRAQMNPHFIFNCLNSINRFIIGNEAEKAADYLTKFARLIRIVLEKSGDSFITLEEELNALKLYMDLETLRFENSFQYEIHTSDIQTEDLLVPSLIIQPFVENAIWHGFEPEMKHHGLIRIHFHLKNNRLVCDILDNGIGISRSKNMNQNHPDHGKSFGIQFTKERLELLGSPENPSTICTEDMNDASGKISGTKVHLEIPITQS